jgi:hypothetical protein
MARTLRAICLRHHPLSSSVIGKAKGCSMLTKRGVLGFDVGSIAPRSQGAGAGRNVTGWVGLIALSPLLAACAPQQSETLNLPVACETAVCDCASDSGFTPKPPPMLWKTDGTAYCPAGYHLHMPPPPSQRMTVQ